MTKPRVYIDSCCLIDLAKHNIGEKLEDDRDKEIPYTKLVLEATRAGEIESYTSTLTVVECLHVNSQIPDEAKALFKSVLTSGQYLRLISPTPFIAEAARDLRWVDGIVIKGRGADYLHVASAIEVGCRELLTFEEKGMRNEAAKIALKGLAIRFPSETTSLTDKRKQMTFLPPPADIEHARQKKKKRGS